jgi:sodium pump decarboxylase gamma subunit
MKKIMKRLSIALMMLVLVMGLTACSKAEEVEEGVSADIVASLESSTESILGTLSILTDEEVDQFLASGDEFTILATNSWLDNREEVGTFVEIIDTTVTLDEGKYHASSEAEFTNKNAVVTIHFDETGVPVYYTMEVQYSLGELMGQAGLNTLMGIGIVFFVLLFLSVLIGLFKYVNVFEKGFGKKAEKAAPVVQKPAPVVAAPVVEELVDDKELVAVIAAAIAAYENTSTDAFVVRSIRRKPNNKWSRA